MKINREAMIMALVFIAAVVLATLLNHTITIATQPTTYSGEVLYAREEVSGVTTLVIDGPHSGKFQIQGHYGIQKGDSYQITVGADKEVESIEKLSQ